jgi:hypothetical protein
VPHPRQRLLKGFNCIADATEFGEAPPQLGQEKWLDQVVARGEAGGARWPALVDPIIPTI